VTHPKRYGPSFRTQPMPHFPSRESQRTEHAIQKLIQMPKPPRVKYDADLPPDAGWMK